MIGSLAALLLSASAAAAVQRVASPSGSGSACTEAAPCGIITAINGAAANDDVTVEAGSYTVAGSTTLTDSGNTLSVHGQAGAPRPVITFTAFGVIGISLSGANSSVSNLEIDTTNSQSFGLQASGGGVVVDRVLVHAFGSSSSACRGWNTFTITNSVCEVDAVDSRAFHAIGLGGAVTLRNDTLEATGQPGIGGYAVLADAAGGHITTVSLTNTIARGTSDDLSAFTDTNASSTASITADHSNYGTAVASHNGGVASVTAPGSGTNQTATPQFVSPGVDDVHELSGSPTIGAGVSSPANGVLDLDGIPRQLGGTTDIGAYQFVPAPTCQSLKQTAGFGQAATVQLSCSDVLGASLSYAIVANPAHGAVTIDAATGRAVYTPAAGYSGSDSFSFGATSSHGKSSPATVSVTVAQPPAPPALPAPRDSQPHLSPTTFTAMARGPAAVAARANGGTIVTYSDSQAATTTFVVQAVGQGGLSHGKCVKRGNTHATHRRVCTLYKTLVQFRHSDSAGANRFRFTGRASGHKLSPGNYRMLATPKNTAGEIGTTQISRFTIRP